VSGMWWRGGGGEGLVERAPRGPEVVIRYGTIASGN
jgi:hypothetical protein